MLSYLDQNCTKTLREALDEHFRAHEDHLIENFSSEKLRVLFQAHDAVHVVFGQDTTVLGETLIKGWTLFGTDFSIRAYLPILGAYLRSPELRAVKQSFGGWRDILNIIRLYAPIQFSMGPAGKRMTKKWPMMNFEAFLDVPLNEIRAEFGIDINAPEVQAARKREAAFGAITTPYSSPAE